VFTITPETGEVSVRGKKVSPNARKLDVVLVAVRYDDSEGRLTLAQGYERRGFVWGDLVLLDRDDVIDRIQAGKRVVAGRRAEIPGDFEVLNPIQLQRLNGSSSLVAEGRAAEGDDLGLPLF
jgi:hypothetical protein